MYNHDPLWNSDRVRNLVAARNAGALIKVGRQARGWRQADLGQHLGCSASTVSRLERHRKTPDVNLLRKAADVLGVPKTLLGAALDVLPLPLSPTRVATHRHSQEDPMRRRTLLTATGLTTPSHLLTRLNSALAVMPAPTSPTTQISDRLRRARGLFDTGEHNQLLAALPDLLATAHAVARHQDATAYVRLSAAYALATELLSKIGRNTEGRITADRAALYAELSSSPVTAAAAARVLSIVLRHQDQPEAAHRVTMNAIATLEATGLRAPEQAAAYVQMLCSTSYVAARAGDRDQALDMIREAANAADRLPPPSPTGRFTITPAAVSLYEVGVHWALGDAGTALHTGRTLRPEQFPTAERRARLHTDMARAWWQWGKPERTTQALLAAHRVAPAEVRDRPAIRAIAVDLARHHAKLSGVPELSHAVLSGAVSAAPQPRPQGSGLASENKRLRH